MNGLTDLHLHLLGSIAPSAVQELIVKHQQVESLFTENQQQFIETHLNTAQLLSRSDGNSLRSFSTLKEFLACYLFTSGLIRSRQDLQLLTSSVLEQLPEWNMSYAEITVSPSLYIGHGISLEELIETLSTSRETFCKQHPEIAVHWLLDPIRNRGPEAALQQLHEVHSISNDFLCGVSLAGDEESISLEEFLPYFKRAKDLGLGATVHAGENHNPDSVRDALALPIDRIGHGVAAAFDDGVLAEIQERSITLEVCPTGNIKTGLFSSFAAHPMRKLFDAGVIITINSDDPFFFQTNISEEYAQLKKHNIFSESEATQLLQNSKNARFR